MDVSSTLQIGAKAIIYLATLFALIYALILGYHYTNYGSSTKLSTLALSIFVGGSVALILGLTVAYNLF